MKLTGLRTFTFATFSGVVLLIGFSMVPPDARGGAFVFFSGGISALVVAVAGKSVGSKFADAKAAPTP